MVCTLDSNKTKIAKRVIEVFEFFDGGHSQATVMDIVRRYDRPQSSTSELMASLVELGLLYKDPRSRSYSPTPRLAVLGASAQPAIIRDGRLFAFMDRLAYSTRHAVALFGMVGTHVQIFRWSPGADPATHELGSGASERLSASAAGLLLLSTMPADLVQRILWRLNAEAAAQDKFNPADLAERVATFGRLGHATGTAGFLADSQATAALLPHAVGERPLAIGLVYPGDAALDTDALAATLLHGIGQCAACDDPLARPAATAPLRMVAV